MSEEVAQRPVGSPKQTCKARTPSLPIQRRLQNYLQRPPTSYRLEHLPARKKMPGERNNTLVILEWADSFD